MKFAVILLALALATFTRAAETAGARFPTSELETTLRAARAELTEGDERDLWEVSASWPTERDRTCVVEARVADGDWKARSESFRGDGQPVDFVDLFEAGGRGVAYRLVSRRAADGADARIATLRPGFVWDESLGHPLGRVDFFTRGGDRIEVFRSNDTAAWISLLAFTEDQAVAENLVEDPSFRPGVAQHYRVQVTSPSGRVDDDSWESAAPAARRHRLKEKRVSAATGRAADAAPAVGRSYPNRVVRSLDFETIRQRVQGGLSYAVIKLDAPGQTVDLNSFGEVLLSRRHDDGQHEMILWIAGDHYNVSKVTGQRFHRVLDIDDERSAVGSLLIDGKETLIGYRYSPPRQSGGKLNLRPLTAEELRAFRLTRHEPIFEGPIRVGGEEVPPDSSGRIRSMNRSNSQGILLSTTVSGADAP